MLVVGCAQSHAARSGPHLEFHRDLARWSLPLDQYDFADSSVANYAQNLLISQCMEKRGYRWPVPRVHVSAPFANATRNSEGRRLFSLDIAKEYGYHSAPDAQLAGGVAAGLSRLNDQHRSKKELKVFERCLSKERRALPLPSLNLLEVFKSAAYNAAIVNPAVLVAEEKWRSCMAALGFPGLPRSPMHMPTTAMIASFREHSRRNNAGSREIVIATHDAICRQNSGYDAALYKAEFEQQIRDIAGNVASLQALKLAVEQYRRSVYATIADLSS